ncbi:MAG: peptidoglycan-binding protein [Clostridia bacterium]|nr:peptidoglycan-binding protein [Clostridia bacterium]
MREYIRRALTASGDCAKRFVAWIKRQKASTLCCAGAGVLALVLLIVVLAATANGAGGAPLSAAVEPEPLESGLAEPNFDELTIPEPNDGDGAEETPAPTMAPAVDEPVILLTQGDTDESLVPLVQSRLMGLYYMDADEPTSYFGPATAQALRLFQRRHGVEEDGVLTQECYDMLMASDALRYVASVGDEGTDISEIQQRLYELDYLGSVTGYFGTDTEAAVKLFQKNNGLTSDGKVGVETKEALYSADAKANYFYLGSRSEVVQRYQEILKSLGYLTTTPDGIYGEDTVAAVRRFQERNSLIPDGYLGPKTREVLTSGNAQANALMIGMSGEDVRRVQVILKNLDYLYESHCTGYFGSITETAVKEFQRRNDLGVDGKVGRLTMAKLTGDDMVGPGSSYVVGGGSGSDSGGGGGESGVRLLIQIARSKKGCPYVLGGKGPNVFDCSGLVYWCLNQAGVSQPYLTSIGWRSVTHYQRISSIDDVQAGDILVFKMSETQGHVGIAVSGSVMVDASNNQGEVVERSFMSSYWDTHFYCAYRVF